MTQYFKIPSYPFNGVVNVWSGDFADIAEDIQKKNKSIDIDDLFDPGDIAATWRIYSNIVLMICIISLLKFH